MPGGPGGELGGAPIGGGSMAPRMDANRASPRPDGAMWAHCQGAAPAFWRHLILQINFLIDSHNLLAIDAHGLDAHHLVSYKAHKIHVRRRSAVNPLFIIRVASFSRTRRGGRPLA